METWCFVISFYLQKGKSRCTLEELLGWKCIFFAWNTDGKLLHWQSLRCIYVANKEIGGNYAGKSPGILVVAKELQTLAMTPTSTFLSPGIFCDICCMSFVLLFGFILYQITTVCSLNGAKMAKNMYGKIKARNLIKFSPSISQKEFYFNLTVINSLKSDFP